MADYNVIVGALNQQAQKEQEAALDMQKLFFAMGQNQAQAAEAEKDGTFAFNGKQETMESAKVRMQADLEAQQEKRKFADTLDYNSLSVSLAQETAATVATQRELARTIEAKASVSLFEDPFTALSHAFTMPWDQQALDATHTKLTLLSDASSKINSAITQHSDTTDKLKESITQASLDSITTGLANDQHAKYLKNHNEALRIDAAGVEAVTRMNHQQLATLESAYRVVTTAENQAFLREQRAAALEERAEQRKNKETAAKLIDEDVALVQEKLATEGKSGRFSNEEIKSRLLRNDPIFSHLRDRAVISRLQGRAPDGESPIERSQSWLITGVNPKTDGQKLLVSANMEAEEKTKDIKDKATRSSEAQKLLEKRLDGWQKAVGSGDKNNPLALPSFESLAVTSSIVNNPAFALIKDVVTSDATKTQPIDANLIFGNMINGIANKAIKLEDASRLLFDIGMASKEYNARIHEVYKYTGWDQTKSVVQLKPGSLIGDLAIAAGPAITAAGLLTGVGAIPATTVGVGFVGAGNMMNSVSINVNLMDEVDIKHKLAHTLARKFTLGGVNVLDPTEAYRKSITSQGQGK